MRMKLEDICNFVKKDACAKNSNANQSKKLLRKKSAFVKRNNILFYIIKFIYYY
jgi:hypothetical protein